MTRTFSKALASKKLTAIVDEITTKYPFQDHYHYSIELKQHFYQLLYDIIETYDDDVPKVTKAFKQYTDVLSVIEPHQDRVFYYMANARKKEFLEKGIKPLKKFLGTIMPLTRSIHHKVSTLGQDQIFDGNHNEWQRYPILEGLTKDTLHNFYSEKLSLIVNSITDENKELMSKFLGRLHDNIQVKPISNEEFKELFSYYSTLKFKEQLITYYFRHVPGKDKQNVSFMGDCMQAVERATYPCRFTANASGHLLANLILKDKTELMPKIKEYFIAIGKKDWRVACAYLQAWDTKIDEGNIVTTYNLDDVTPQLVEKDRELAFKIIEHNGGHMKWRTRATFGKREGVWHPYRDISFYPTKERYVSHYFIYNKDNYGGVHNND